MVYEIVDRRIPSSVSSGLDKEVPGCDFPYKIIKQGTGAFGTAVCATINLHYAQKIVLALNILEKQKGD
jgi:hypothetical protein